MPLPALNALKPRSARPLHRAHARPLRPRWNPARQPQRAAVAAAAQVPDRAAHNALQAQVFDDPAIVQDFLQPLPKDVEQVCVCTSGLRSRRLQWVRAHCTCLRHADACIHPALCTSRHCMRHAGLGGSLHLNPPPPPVTHSPRLASTVCSGWRPLLNPCAAPAPVHVSWMWVRAQAAWCRTSGLQASKT